MRLERMLLRGFPPFVDCELYFPPKTNPELAEIHILAGSNGCGKTRLLSMMLAHLGNPIELKSRCEELSSDSNFALWESEVIYYTRLARVGNGAAYFTDIRMPIDKLASLFGIPTVNFGKNYPVPTAPAKQLTPLAGHLLESKNQRIQPIAICYKGNASISDSQVSAMNTVEMQTLTKDLIFTKEVNESQRVGQSLVNLKLAAAMDLMQGGNHGKSIKLVNQIEDAITAVTGKKFSFRVIPQPTVQLRVDWGNKSNMSLNQLPDGLRSIIGWVVGCCTKIIHHLPESENPFEASFVLILDEPETNLHPAWQRKILPAIQKLFINAQIIVATHSPFMISSVNEGYVHVMKFNENDEVFIEEAKACSKGDSYIDVLEELMGVKEWFDPETEDLLQNFRDKRDAAAPLEDLELLARNIADRGEYLAEMMGREMAQLRRKAASNKAS